jgi:aminoglycoside phosphotransferase (APT) family kinase protein
MAATALLPFDRVPLSRFLAEASGAERVEITAFDLLSGGAIQENWGFEAVFAGGSLAGRQLLVLRTDAATGIPSSLSRVEEFAVLRAVHAAGVTVPEPLFACADPGIIGKPFFVMRRVAGTAQGRHITTDPGLEPALPRIAARLGEELARIQTIRPPRSDLAFLPSPEESAPARQIAGFRAYLDRHPNPRPVLEWAARWLETHIPAPLGPVLCHRDFRTGNYMLAPTHPSPASGGGSGWGLTGILDWEFAGWGDPDEDIGWFCCKGWRFARLDREAGGIAERAPFYAGYERATGRGLDPDRIRFWEIFANVRWAIIALQQSDRYLIGGARDLSTAIIGRRAGECELELLMLLDPGGAPGQGPRASRRQCPLSSPPPLAGEGRVGGGRDGRGPDEMRDLPSGLDLAELGRRLLLDELLPLLPPDRHRDLHLVATAIAIAAREAMAGEGPTHDILGRLAEFYGRTEISLSALQGGEGGDPSRSDGEGEVGSVGKRFGIPHLTPALSAPGGGEGDGEGLIGRFALDLRNGAFETYPSQERAARAILWRLTIARLREANPQFLAANGFG